MTHVPAKWVHVADSRHPPLIHYRHPYERNHGMNCVPGRLEERFATSMPVRLERGGAVTRDVSASGIYFVTDVPFEAGASVKFALDFQDFPGGPIQVNCIARVVRIEEHGEKKGVGAAIHSFEFHRLPMGGQS
jgi:hypothetical protein